MNLRPHPRVIALDVGGVLYYDEPFELAWLQDVLDHSGADVGEFNQRVRAFYLQPGTGTPVLYPPLGTSGWHRVRAAWSDLAQPVPGALNAVNILARRYELCVIANQPPECLQTLKDLGLAQHMRAIALDSLVGISKPDPGLFQWALERLGRRPEDLLMVGDRPAHDAVPARALGCQAVIVRPDDGWRPPDGVNPALLAAYRGIRRERARRAAAANSDWLTITDLAELARTLPGHDPDNRTATGGAPA